MSLPAFAAIDFETATAARTSACAVGVVRVEAGRIVASAQRRIRPPSRLFTTTHIHGLSWRDVASADPFPAVWAQLAPLCEGVEFLVAHNAPFDRSVLLQTAAWYGLSLLPPPFACTVQVARRVWRCRPATLPAVCAALGIPLERHHDALADATAAAHIMRAALAAGWRPRPLSGGAGA